MAEGPTRVPEASVESSATAVEWAAITGGALAAIGITIILLALGPALGLATVNPGSFGTSPPAAFGIAAGIWLIVTQWLSSGLGEAARKAAISFFFTHPYRYSSAPSSAA